MHNNNNNNDRQLINHSFMNQVKVILEHSKKNTVLHTQAHRQLYD